MATKQIKKSVKTKKKGRTWLKIIVLLALVGSLLGGTVAVVGYFYLSAQLPTVETIADYKPATGTKVYSFDGELIAEFDRNNKRNIVPYNKLPKKLRLAFIAGEDAEFYNHWGIRPTAMPLISHLC